jgi:predicted RNA binding protein YcfA (HicA-like mRNA interferase family)
MKKPPRKSRVDWPSARASGLIRALKKLGFIEVEGRGGHRYFMWPDAPARLPIQVPWQAQKEFQPHYVKATWMRAHNIMGVSEQEFLKVLK